MVENDVHAISSDYQGIKMLDITPLLETKLKSYAARAVSRDASDIMYLVEVHTAAIEVSKLNKTQVDYFLANAELNDEQRRKAVRVLLLGIV